jgi:hypothetical protein
VADEIIMKNGSRLVGTLISVQGDKIKFDTPFAGELSVAVANVEAIYTDKPITVLMEDGRVLHDQQIVARQDVLTMQGPDNQVTSFKPSDIAAINPEPWRMGDGYRWSGKLSGALEAERGNSDSDELDFEGESVWRSLVDRYTVRGLWERDETNNKKITDNWRIRGKYDHFRQHNPNDYFGWLLAFESDDFADLDLRTITGPYVGRQYFDTHLLDLAGEIGLVYVDEQFIEADDDDFIGSSWELRLTSDWLSEHTEFYVNQDGIINFDDFDGVLVNTTIGIGFPIINGLMGAFEAKFEYDGGAVEGVDELDETYKFRLGYEW